MEAKVIIFEKAEGILTLTKWLNIHRYNSKTLDAKKIILDLTKFTFFEPQDIVPLACLIHEYISNGIIVEFIPPNSSIFSYLNSFEFFKVSTGELNGALVKPRITTFNLLQVLKPITESHPIDIVRFYERNRFYDKSIGILGTAIAELLNNICDHSNTSHAFTFTQFKPRKMEFRTCICDFGVGIPSKIIEFLKKENKIVSELEAMQMSISRGFSVKSNPRNKGLGLDNVLQIIENLKGSIMIYSNSILYLFRYENGIFKQNWSVHKTTFGGTFVLIKFDARNLQNKEVEDLLEF